MATTVSPGWNSADTGTWKQNWLRVPAPRKAKSPKLLRVHATVVVSCTENRHSMSWIAWVIAAPAAKSGGSTPGTPPNGVGGGPMSHTAVLPNPTGSVGSPTGRESRICRSPRSLPAGKRFVPGLTLELPRRASTTSRNWPALCTNTSRPLSSMKGVGVGVSWQENSQQNGHPSCAIAPT